MAWPACRGYHRAPVSNPRPDLPAAVKIMNETEFNQAADVTLLAIEEAVEALQDEHDIDFEMSSGILTLIFESGSKVIINRQIATREIWVAARSGGFHLGRKNDDWFCNTTNESLAALLSRVCSEQSGETVKISL